MAITPFSNDVNALALRLLNESQRKNGRMLTSSLNALQVAQSIVESQAHLEQAQTAIAQAVIHSACLADRLRLLQPVLPDTHTLEHGKAHWLSRGNPLLFPGLFPAVRFFRVMVAGLGEFVAVWRQS